MDGPYDLKQHFNALAKKALITFNAANELHAQKDQQSTYRQNIRQNAKVVMFMWCWYNVKYNCFLIRIKFSDDDDEDG